MASTTKMASRMECTVVMVGDARTGKTAMVRRLTEDNFEESYVPTGFDKALTLQEVNKHEVEFVLWDTSGSPSYDSVRGLSYQEADVFLVCFKISDPISLYNVKNKWIPDLRKHRPRTPVVLCGTHSDLRGDPTTTAQLSKTGRTPVSHEQALAICCEIEAVNYVETSAKADIEVHEAFEVCALAAIKYGGGDKPIMARRCPSNSSFGKMSGMFGGSQKSIHSAASASSAASAGNGNSRRHHPCNNSFSGSENNNVILDNASVQHSTILEDDDVFPATAFGGPPPPPLSPRLLRDQQQRNKKPQHHRTSLGCLQKAAARNEFMEAVATAEVQQQQQHQQRNGKSPRSSSASTSVVVVDITQAVPAVASAQVRPNGLSRRTSFRSQGKTPTECIPVATPKSPLGSASSYDLKSPASSTSTVSPMEPKNGVVVRQGANPASNGKLCFESLKSHTSTGSQGSTGSKASTASSSASSSNNRSNLPKILDPDVPDTEDPELLSKLQFVSPKSGVFRPVAQNGNQSGKKKQNCRVM